MWLVNYIIPPFTKGAVSLQIYSVLHMADCRMSSFSNMLLYNIMKEFEAFRHRLQITINLHITIKKMLRRL